MIYTTGGACAFGECGGEFYIIRMWSCEAAPGICMWSKNIRYNLIFGIVVSPLLKSVTSGSYTFSRNTPVYNVYSFIDIKNH